MSGEAAERIELEGGCHCGRVRFRVTLPVALPRALDCNCSICSKKGFLHLIVDRSQFSLLAGGEELTRYSFNTGTAVHTFCRVCGIHAFYTPRSHPDGVDVNLRCLDDPDGTLLTRFSVAPFDGRNWEDSVDEIR